MQVSIMILLMFFTGNSVFAGQQNMQSGIINNDGKKIGALKVQQGNQGIVVNIEAQNLPPGYHGLHFHAVGDCSDLKQFKSAEGHVDPNKKPHGFLNSNGPHEGNLPNLVVAADGSANVELYSTMVSLNSGQANLLDEDGSALIIHADPDDHKSQPIGGSGARIACSVIK